MKLTPRRRVLMVAPLLLVSLSGCASASHFITRLWRFDRPAVHQAQQLQMRPILTATGDTPTSTPEDRLYQAAAKDIMDRDYVAALDLLQLAREAAPNDVRVLNALGVVYDKLGRFDLSDRYYAQAAAAEPGSAIVASNMRYSAMMRDALQHVGAAPAPVQAVAQADAPARASVVRVGGYLADQGPLRAISTAQPGSQVLRLAVADGQVRRASPIITGGALTLVNATGRTQAVQPARQFLASAGWSVAPGEQPSSPLAHSEIRFAAQNQTVAMALAKTLPFKVALSPCAGSCALQLVLGQDSPAVLGQTAGRS